MIKKYTGLSTIISFALILSLCSLGIMAGCAKKLPPEAVAPAWVTKGSAAFNDQGSRVFY